VIPRPAKALPALGALLLLVGIARAEQPGAASTADALFNEGATLLKAGKVAAACDKLSQSQSIEPAIGTLGLLAYCHEQSGLLATAIREYGEVAELAHLAAQPGRETVARDKVAELSGRVTRLSVVLSDPPPHVEVFLDERRLGASELGASTPVDSGTFTLRVRGLGVQEWTQTLEIPADGSTLRVVVPRLAPVAKPAIIAAKAAPQPALRGDTSGPRLWVSLGVGALGLVAGSYFGISAVAADADSEGHCVGNQCDQAGVDARERALDRARWSTIAFSVGVIGAAAGTVLFLTDRREQPRQSAAVRVVPGGAAVAWERRF
jgi:hypothetical protein